jgi:excisionase family DNA binding protein
MPRLKPVHRSPVEEYADMTIADVADAIRFSQRGVRKLVADGRLPAYRIGRQLRFRESDVRALFQKIGG